MVVLQLPPRKSVGHGHLVIVISTLREHNFVLNQKSIGKSPASNSDMIFFVAVAAFQRFKNCRPAKVYWLADLTTTTIWQSCLPACL